jgi:hypothetical protein
LDGVQAAFTKAQTALASGTLTLADVKGIDAAFNDAVTSDVTAPTTTATPTVSFSPSPTQDVRAFNDSFGGIGGFGDLNINVNGGLATSAEIGQAIVNALRAYNRAAGPASISTSAYI